MYAGRVVEKADKAALFAAPRHPYSAALIGATANDARSVADLVGIPWRVAFALQEIAYQAVLSNRERVETELAERWIERERGVLYVDGGITGADRSLQPSARG